MRSVTVKIIFKSGALIDIKSCLEDGYKPKVGDELREWIQNDRQSSDCWSDFGNDSRMYYDIREVAAVLVTND